MTRLAATVFALSIMLGTFTATGSAARPGKPSNTASPAISGSVATGETISTSNGQWSGWSPMTYRYQWQRCGADGSGCANIAGANAQSYALVAADAGSAVRSSVTAKNSRGSTTAYSIAAAVGTAPQADTAAPTVPASLAVGNVTQTTMTLSWAASSDDRGVAGYRVYRNGTLLATTSLAHAHTDLSCGTSYTLGLEAFDAAGNTSTRASAGATTAACAITPSGEYFGTLAVGAAVPRTDTDCAVRVTRNPWDPRPGNETANRTVPTTAVQWNNTTGWTYWRAFISKRDKVTGNFTGTTDEIIQWVACKWGIDEDVIRAVAVQESSWQQSQLGDYQDGRYHSFGIMQIRHDDASGALVKGGYPHTLQHTALNVDYFGAELRACFEGDFHDGGPWLYGGVQVKSDLWGCVGYWYSGNWYTEPAKDYIAKIQNHLAAKPWIAWRYFVAPAAPSSPAYP